MPSQTLFLAVPATEDPFNELMSRVARGDERAFRPLVDHWRLPLIRFFRRGLPSAEDAEDLAIETLTRVYRASGRYEPRGKFATYLFAIARNVLISHYRKRGRRPELVAAEEGPEPSANPLPAREAREMEEQVERALERLPEKYRTPLLLAVQEDLSLAEVADILNLSTEAVKMRVHRARQKLRDTLSRLEKTP